MTCFFISSGQTFLLERFLHAFLFNSLYVGLQEYPCQEIASARPAEEAATPASRDRLQLGRRGLHAARLFHEEVCTTGVRQQSSS